MSSRNETTESRQLAEMAAVDIVGKRNLVENPLYPIKWIRERKVVQTSEDGTSVVIWFLFRVHDKSRPEGEFNPLTAVTVLLKREGKGKKWNLVSAGLESEYQPGKPSKEKWGFLPDGTSQKVG
jgi:hypothetical protein